MKATSATTAAALLTLMMFGSALIAQQTQSPAHEAVAGGSPNAQPAALAPVASAANSKVRIVRLSQVKGQVQFDPDAATGFEAALPNLPVTEGARLQTDSGVAEVEFEDNSTLRLAPDTLVEFPQLELRPAGAKVSVVHVVKGTVYASLASTKDNEFTLTFGSQTLTLPPSSHIRLQVEPAQATLAVFKGNLEVDGPAGTTAVAKKRTLTFNLTGQNQPTLAKNVAENQFDAWDQNQVDYHERYMRSSGAYGNVPYAFGMSDMNYYGSFMDLAGCGAMWRPYFVSAAWDPYANGAWAWYSGAGYSWVSPYPWGWMPYHYGSWNYCPGAGWGWMPGGSWMGLANAPGRLNPLRGFGGVAPGGARPIMPSRPPIARGRGLIPVNLRPLAVSDLATGNTFVFRKDSAGLGIPRGSFGKLNSFSHGVQRQGSVSMPVYSVPITEAGAGRRTANAGANSPLGRGVPGGNADARSYTHSRVPGDARSAGTGRTGSMGSRPMGGNGSNGSMGSASRGAGSMGGSGRMGSGSMGSGGPGGSSASHGAPAGGRR